MVGLGSNDSLRGIFSHDLPSSHFSLTTTQLGLIVTASYIGNLVFLLVGGNLSTRFSKKARAAGTDPDLDGRPGAVCLYQTITIGAAHRHGAGAGFFHAY